MRERIVAIRHALAEAVELARQQSAPWFQEHLRLIVSDVDELLELPMLSLNRLPEAIAAVSPSLLNALEEREALLIECDQLRENYARANAELSVLQARWDEGEAVDKPIMEALIELENVFGESPGFIEMPRMIRMAAVSVQQCQAIGDILEGYAEQLSSTEWVELGVTLSVQVEKLVEHLCAELVQQRVYARKLDAAMEATLAATAQLSESTDKVSELEFHLKLNQREACEERMWRHDNHAKAQEREKHLRLKLKRAAKVVAHWRRNSDRITREKYDAQRINSDLHTRLEQMAQACQTNIAEAASDRRKARINDIAASASLRALDELATALAKLRTEALADE